MDRRITVAAALITVALSAAAAQADVPHVDTRDNIAFAPPGNVVTAPELAKPQAKNSATWYGWQIMLADVASLVAASRGHGYGLILGGPAVHALNGQSKRAWRSLGLRVGLPFAGALLGYGVALDRCGQPNARCSGLEGMALVGLGVGAGWLTASLVDAIYLARKPKQSRERRRMVKLPVQPSVSFVEGGAVLGVGSNF